MSEVRRVWFEALELSEKQNQLEKKTQKKQSKINAVVDQITQLVDEISNNTQISVIDIDDKSQDMIIQKQIVSANALIQKVREFTLKADREETDTTSSVSYDSPVKRLT